MNSVNLKDLSMGDVIVVRTYNEIARSYSQHRYNIAQFIATPLAPGRVTGISIEFYDGCVRTLNNMALCNFIRIHREFYNNIICGFLAGQSVNNLNINDLWEN